MAISGLLLGVIVITGIVSLVSAIIVLIQMFKKGGVGMGLLGIFTCFLGAYVWGWIKSRELNLMKVMLAWTAAIVVSMIANVFVSISAAQAMQNDPEFRKLMEQSQQQYEAPAETPALPETEPAPQN